VTDVQMFLTVLRGTNHMLRGRESSMMRTWF